MLETIKEFLLLGVSIVGVLSVLTNVIQLAKKKKVDTAVKLLGATVKDLEIPDELKDKVKAKIKDASEKLGIEKTLNKVYTKYIKNDNFKKKVLETKKIWS